MNTTTAPATPFVKATLQEPVLVDGPLGFAPSRVTLTTHDEAYARLLAQGYTVVETWNVWHCTTCGFLASDRRIPAWEIEHFGDVTHLGRHGHEATRA